MSNNRPKPRPSADQQPYDNVLKSLLEGEEARLLPYFLAEANFIECLNIEVIRTPMRTDRVYKVLYHERIHILHIEFETGSDGDMAYRLLEYHSYLLRKYKHPVISIVVYPFEASLAVSPLIEMSGEECLLSFRFRTLPLRQLSAEKYLNEHAVGIYALLPAMQGANSRLLHKAIDEMVEYYRGNDAKLSREIRWLGIMLRRATTISEEDKQLLEVRLNMFNELFENDPKMKTLLAAREARGETRGLQDAVISVVEERFPPLKELAQQQVQKVTDPPVLNLLLRKISVTSDENTVRIMLNLIAA